MPYVSEDINLNKKIGLDRRIKLTPEQKNEIQYKYWHGKHQSTLKVLATTVSQRSLAKEYSVSRRTIVWILFPERLIRNKQLRLDRGGWKQYYNTRKNTTAIRKTRHWKQKLYLQKIITTT